MQIEYPEQKQPQRYCQRHLCGSSGLCHRMAYVPNNPCGGVDSPKPLDLCTCHGKS